MKKGIGALLALLLVCMSAAGLAEENWLASVLGNAAAKSAQQHTVAVLRIDGEIYDGGSYYGYDHEGTLQAIADLRESGKEEALLLVLNTPGGSLYEADELYDAILRYKATGRTVYAYMEQECCSAGVFLAMTADYIMAARMTITGNVGVYMESYSEAGLLEKLGLEHVYVASGENKTAGYPTLTGEQRDIYQALVDESFAIFKAAIADARGMSEEEMAPFLDGRLLSALQAREMGLIDEVGYYEDMLAYVEAQVGADGGDVRFKDVTPETGMDWYGGDSLMNWLPDLDDLDLEINQKDPSAQLGRLRQGVLMSLRK